MFSVYVRKFRKQKEEENKLMFKYVKGMTYGLFVKLNQSMKPNRK